MAIPGNFPTGSVSITGYVAPTNLADQYATHIDAFGKGGYRTLPDIAARDAIFDDRKSIGMLVYTESTDEIWKLESIAPDVWVLSGINGLERGGIAWDSTFVYLKDDMVFIDDMYYVALVDNIGIDPRINPTEWQIDRSINSEDNVVTGEHRINEIVWITQADYDLILVPDTDKLYIIEGEGIPVAITDFVATDTLVGQVQVTFTEV